MPAFFIADIRIHDPERHRAYLASLMEIFARHGGKLRVISCAPAEVTEGTWAPSGIVVMEFTTRAQAEAWKDGPDDQQTAKVRHDTAETNMILVAGL
jgi:uncharacterized protein (DUF1330 family)